MYANLIGSGDTDEHSKLLIFVPDIILDSSLYHLCVWIQRKEKKWRRVKNKATVGKEHAMNTFCCQAWSSHAAKAFI